MLASELDQDPLTDCFHKTELEEVDNNEENEEEATDMEEKKVDQNFQNHRISTASASSRDSASSSYSVSSGWSVPSMLSESSSVDSDFSEDTEEVDDQSQQEPCRRKPKKKSRSLLGMERFSLLFKYHRSPSLCRRAQSMGFRGDVTIRDCPATGSRFKRSKSLPRQVRPLLPGTSVSSPPASLDPQSTQRHVCVRRRPILSCDKGDVMKVSNLVRVVVFGGDREAGRLARAYSDLQQRESKCPCLTRTCRLQFYFIPAKRRRLESPGGGLTQTEGQTGSPFKGTLSMVRILLILTLTCRSI